MNSGWERVSRLGIHGSVRGDDPDPLRLVVFINYRAIRHVIAHERTVRKSLGGDQKLGVDPIDSHHAEQERVVFVRGTPEHLAEHFRHRPGAILNPGTLFGLMGKDHRAVEGQMTGVQPLRRRHDDRRTAFFNHYLKGPRPVAI
jgi:hypothetical protein